jgi:L-lactate utilization protein LutC
MTTATRPELDEAFAVPAADEQLHRAAEALRGNGFSVHIVDTAAEARHLVRNLLPTDRTVFTSASETLREAGIAADIDESGDFRSVRAAAPADLEPADRMKLGSTADLIVGSVHAVTEQGQLVAGSASGSQLGPYATAPNAIWVVGAQKVVPDLATALRRLHTYSYPREWERMMSARGMPSMLGKVLIIEREYLPERATVVLVREPLGF